ncbi:MAG: primosomal protein N' [Muribaculaceae bacterium]|nr:primosomal protein N' [Muribaculaceae bacterium]
MFAEVILPLPLYSTFTYSIPADMRGDVGVGTRVLVQFGTRKFYTGIISSIHDSAPVGYEVKEISALLDSSPIVRYPQLRLWEWIASYYLCSPGEVYKAALPTGLKPESSTVVSLNPDFDLTELEGSLSETDASIIQLLDSEKKLSVGDIEKTIKSPNILTRLKPLLDRGVVEISEKIVERYAPKVEKMIALDAKRGDHDALHAMMDIVARSKRRERALIAYLDLSGWMQEQSPLREVTRQALIERSGATPAILKAMEEKGIFRFYKKVVNRFHSEVADLLPPASLSPAQEKAKAEILNAFRDRQVALLHGVTGSGKTEIYTHLIHTTLEAGRQVLFLVPEISLTTQLTDRLRKFFGERLLVYHSKFTDNERVDIWKRLLHSNDPLLILGARSSVFLPFANLGLVIVDEEHEASFKQYDPAPRYNARDTAIMLASMHGAKTLLGSATPAVDTYYKASEGKYGLITLSERFEGAELPEVETVDMRDQKKRKLNKGIFSAPLHLAVDTALKEKKQALLFQNRRGFAPFVVCDSCGWSPRCVNCDVSLVYHKYSDQLRCHYCGYAIPRPAVCPACGSNSVEVYGYGTERIAEETHLAFPEARVSRMDLDTTRNKNSYQEIIEEFASHDTDILVGTQMLSKGLDFGDVTVVGVLGADSLLNFPDFRSNERAFNMLEQVAGRAGRRAEKGRVVIQTSDPDNAVLAFVKAHDYQGFYRREIQSRRRLLYPPFSRIINIYLKNKDPHMAEEGARLMADALRNVFGARVLGPEKPFVSRIATWYLQSIMLKIEATASMTKVKHILRTLYESLARDRRIKSSIIYYDVDPS